MREALCIAQGTLRRHRRWQSWLGYWGNPHRRGNSRTTLRDRRTRPLRDRPAKPLCGGGGKPWTLCLLGQHRQKVFLYG